MMYKELNRHESFEAAIQAVYGRTLDQLNDEFQLAMRRQYYPSVDSLAPLSVLGIEIARLGVKATALPDTGRSDGPGQIAYMSPGRGIHLDLPEGHRAGRQGTLDRHRRPLAPSWSRFTRSSPAWMRRGRDSCSSRPGTAIAMRSSSGTCSVGTWRAGTSSRSWCPCSRLTGCPTGRASW